MGNKKDSLCGLETATVHVLETEEYQAIACETPSDGLRVWVTGIPACKPYARKWINPLIPVRDACNVRIEWRHGSPVTDIDITDHVGYRRYYCKQYTLFNDPKAFWKEINH